MPLSALTQMYVVAFGVQLRSLPLVFLAVLGLAGIYAGLWVASGAVPVNDKVQHFVYFLLFGLSLYWVPNLSRKRCSQITGAVMLAFSLTSESLQAYLTTRTFDSIDILANTLGSALSLLINRTYHTWMLQRKRDSKFAALADLEGFVPVVDDDLADDLEMHSLEEDGPLRPSTDLASSNDSKG